MKKNLYTYLAGNEYPGRGICIGRSPDGTKAMIAYWIMGRSANSRNRVFDAIPGGIRTVAADPAKLEDPHLIIYNPVLTLNDTTIVTNGDQTDTIYRYMRDNLITTYQKNGSPIPSFAGEPLRVTLDQNDADEFAGKLWEALNEDNKVSLFVRAITLETGDYEDVILNKYNTVEG